MRQLLLLRCTWKPLDVLGRVRVTVMSLSMWRQLVNFIFHPFTSALRTSVNNQTSLARPRDRSLHYQLQPLEPAFSRPRRCTTSQSLSTPPYHPPSARLRAASPHNRHHG